MHKLYDLRVKVYDHIFYEYKDNLLTSAGKTTNKSLGHFKKRLG